MLYTESYNNMFGSTFLSVKFVIACWINMRVRVRLNHGFPEIIIYAMCYSFNMVCDYMTCELCKVQTDTLLHIQVKHVLTIIPLAKMELLAWHFIYTWLTFKGMKFHTVFIHRCCGSQSVLRILCIAQFIYLFIFCSNKPAQLIS